MITPRKCEVVEGTARPLWVPISARGGSSSLYSYQGGLVKMTYGTADGIEPVAAASGATVMPFGVVLGFNNVDQDLTYSTTYGTTYSGQKITLATIDTNQYYTRMQEGMWIKGDGQAMAQVAVIDFTSVLRLPIYAHATNLTAPTEAISTAGNANGLTVTCGTTGFDTTAVAYENTIYCRKGLNKGIYRTTYDTNAGTSAKTWYIPTPYTTATTGETWVQVPFKVGRTHIDLQTTGLGINTATGGSLATNYYTVDCLEIHLEEQGNEYALVRFVA